MSRNTSHRLPRINTMIKTLLVVAFAGALALAGAACSESSENNSSFDIGTGPITTKAKDPITKEAVQKLADRKLGDAGAAGQSVVRAITLTPEAAGTSVLIDLNRASSCHAGALVGTGISMAQQMMSAVFRYPDVSKVQVTLFGPTEAPEDLNKPAVRIMVTKDAAAKIDWFQFTEKTVTTLASEYWVEPCVYQNYQQYGGAVITDEGLLSEAKSGCSATPAT